MSSQTKLLGTLPFVSRTFEGGFKENPFVMDLDGNLYIGPADHVTRDEHATIEVVYHFLSERHKVKWPVRDLLRSRQLLLDAFAAFDEARSEGEGSDFRIIIFGTYDAVALAPIEDDELPAGPCGTPINAIKRRFYEICRRLDRQFLERHLNQRQQRAEARILTED